MSIEKKNKYLTYNEEKDYPNYQVRDYVVHENMYTQTPQ